MAKKIEEKDNVFVNVDGKIVNGVVLDVIEDTKGNVLTARVATGHGTYRYLASEIHYTLDKGNSAVNHPTHYTSHPSGIECIQVTEHYDFCVGNAIKYLWRAGLKGGTNEKEIEDLNKAIWYINRRIKQLKTK